MKNTSQIDTFNENYPLSRQHINASTCIMDNHLGFLCNSELRKSRHEQEEEEEKVHIHTGIYKAKAHNIIISYRHY